MCKSQASQRDTVKLSQNKFQEIVSDIQIRKYTVHIA